MASIARRPDGTYRPRFRDASGKEHARHFKRKVDAQRWLDEMTAATVTGQYVEGEFVEQRRGLGAVHRHVSSAGVVNWARIRRRPRRMRVLAVPSGMASEREISSAVRP